MPVTCPFLDLHCERRESTLSHLVGRFPLECQPDAVCTCFLFTHTCHECNVAHLHACALFSVQGTLCSIAQTTAHLLILMPYSNSSTQMHPPVHAYVLPNQPRPVQLPCDQYPSTFLHVCSSQMKSQHLLRCSVHHSRYLPCQGAARRYAAATCSLFIKYHDAHNIRDSTRQNLLLYVWRAGG